MKFSRFVLTLSFTAALGASSAMAARPSYVMQDMPSQTCHAGFMAAKAANTLNGQKYKDYKAAHCVPAGEKGLQKENSSSAAAPSDAVKAAAPGSVVFPAQIAPEFSKLSPGRARMKTCVAQYNANKANGGNGSLKWIQRGGGYWSQCNARLKTATVQTAQ